MLSTFLVFHTAITIPFVEVSAASYEPKGYENEEEEEEEGSYDYPPERDNGYPSMMNDDYTSRGPPPSMMAERGEYDPDRYGGYYGHYEGDFYLDQYVDGNPYDGEGPPYDGEGPPYDGKDNDESPYDGNGSPYILG